MGKPLVSEKLLESKLRNMVKEAGGLAIKMVAVSFVGLPDRIILLPGGRVCFAEIKTTGQKLRPTQVAVKAMLEKMGFDYRVIDSHLDLELFKIDYL